MLKAAVWLGTTEGRTWSKKWKKLHPHVDLRSREGRLRRISKVVDLWNAPNSKGMVSATEELSQNLDKAIAAWCLTKKLDEEKSKLARKSIDEVIADSFRRKSEHSAGKSTGLRRANLRAKRDGAKAKFSLAEQPWAGVASANTLSKQGWDFGWAAPSMKKERRTVAEAVRQGLKNACGKTLSVTYKHHGSNAERHVGPSVTLLRAVIQYLGFSVSESHVADLIRRKR